MKLLKILVIGVLASATVFASAQGFPGGGGGGQRMRMGGTNNPTDLLRREDVKTEIKLTSDQETKLGEVQDEIRTEMMAKFQGGQRPAREEMMKMFAEGQKKANEKIAKILTADQSKRLMELFVQRTKFKAAGNADVQKALGLTEDQVAKIKTLNEGMQKANQGIMQKMMSQELDQEGAQAKFKSNDEALNTEMGKVLTDAQKKKLTEMGGKPFEFKEDQI